MKVAIVEYGVGNLNSVFRAVKHLGHEPVITDDPSELRDADAVILPGVGNFRAAAERLEETGLSDEIRGLLGSVPFLGICLGMQLLMESSEESPESRGLGVFRGTCVALPDGVKKPHMGWNTVEFRTVEFREFDGEMFYFVHSYRVAPEDDGIVLGETEYGERFPSVIGDRRRLIYGTQFHPEKSGLVGLKLLSRVLEGARR
ncbi:imidazole glycerol phosphate synthase subunit HisH [Methanopyrus sp.]